MVYYHVTVSTAFVAAAGTFNNVFIKLVGEDGESVRKWLISFKGAAAFVKGAVSLRFHSSTAYLNCGSHALHTSPERSPPTTTPYI